MRDKKYESSMGYQQAYTTIQQAKSVMADMGCVCISCRGGDISEDMIPFIDQKLCDERERVRERERDMGFCVNMSFKLGISIWTRFARILNNGFGRQGLCIHQSCRRRYQ